MKNINNSMEDLINLLKNSDLKSVEKQTGIPYDRMYKWTKGKSRPKADDFKILMDYFENGQNSNRIIKPNGKISSAGVNRRKPAGLIPYYNADFIAGNAELYYDDNTIYPEYYMDVPEFSGCTAFRAYSDSMEKIIRSGSILFGVKIDDWRDNLEFGPIYGITCHDNRRYLKYIRRSLEMDNFRLLSENPSYDEFDLRKDKIKNIWLIEGWLDKRT